MMSRFAAYVTNTAFSLTLSKAQIDVLSRCYAYKDTFCHAATCSSLERRGLVEVTAKYSDIPESMGISNNVKLTKAGELIIPLLKEACLLVNYPFREEPAETPKVKLNLRKAIHENPEEKT